MTKKPQKTGLGRGISALIPDMDAIDDTSGNFFMCRIEDITPNRYQPRTTFSEEELHKLKESILEQGILQPLLVRRSDNSYELIAGERRLRAARMAALTHVPALIRDLSDRQMLEVSIIENVQREDLNPLEEAEAYFRLITEFNYTQEMVAQKIGKNRSTIANFLRLRGLPEVIQKSLYDNQISMGHARALLGAGSQESQIRAWEIVVAKGLSVRGTEDLIQKIKATPEIIKNQLPEIEQQQINELSQALSRKISSKVRIQKQGDRGKIEISFKNQDEFQHIIDVLNRIS
ncbi:MAG: ParB/RepB/Spo0J family partition protein [Pseudomonadota bacterium]